MKQYDFNEIILREHTACVKYDLRKLYFRTDDVLPMWVADMDFRTPDFIIEAIRNRLDHEILGYSIRTSEFNRSIVNWMYRRHDWTIDEKWISFSPGVVPAVNLLVKAFTSPGDRIIIQPPVYHPFFYAINNNGRTLVENPLRLINGRLSMDFDDLQKNVTGAKMIIISHPHNPGGSVWTREELLQLAGICIENNILIVSDEIHSDLVFNDAKHIPLASLSEDIALNTITCNAPSKTFNIAGLSTSYLIIQNDKHRSHYERVLNDEFHLGLGNLFGAIALQAAYSHGDEWLDQLLSYVQDNVMLVEEFFRNNLPEIKVCIPEATYMIWLDCRDLGLKGDELKDFFIKQAKVGLNDGRTFGTGGEGFMRMNVACPRQLLQQALQQIKSAWERNMVDLPERQQND